MYACMKRVDDVIDLKVCWPHRSAVYIGEGERGPQCGHGRPPYLLLAMFNMCVYVSCCY